MDKNSLKDKILKRFGAVDIAPKKIWLDLEPLGQINVQINRSKKRKSLAIHIKDGEVEARAPLRLKEEKITDFLIKKSRWITKKIRSQNKLPEFKAKTFTSGDIFLILGENYELSIKEGGGKGVAIEGGHINLFLGNKSPLREPQIRAGRQLKNWYLEFATQHINKRVDVFSSIMKEDIHLIQVKNFKSQWGSCSAQGDLKFNWRLIMAPPEVLDYVVVHELAHLKHHNHSKKYWAHVSTYLPEYSEQKKWLKDFGRTLRWD